MILHLYLSFSRQLCKHEKHSRKTRPGNLIEKLTKVQILYLTPAALGEEISVVWRHFRLNIKDDDIDKSLLGARWSLGGIQPCRHQSSRRSGFAQKTLIVTTIINTLTNIWLVIVFHNFCNLLHVKILFLEILNAPGIHFWKGPLFWSIIFLSVVFPQCGNCND